MILMGPPGAGKGTQAKLLEARFRIPHVSSGEILRSAVCAKTELGLEARKYMERGELVPDGVLLGAVRDRLAAEDCRDGFVLDGFPRTVTQSKALGEMLSAAGKPLDHVVSIRVPVSEVVSRLSGRRTCRRCESPYHVAYSPPRRDAVCDKCGGELYQRSDDREETIRARLQAHERQTAPLIEAYREQGVLRDIDGSGSPQEVWARILHEVDA